MISGGEQRASPQPFFRAFRMNQQNLREALKTAVLLAGVASTEHSVEIAELGMVQIKPGRAMIAIGGAFRQVTIRNIETLLAELSQSEEAMRRELQAMVAA